MSSDVESWAYNGVRTKRLYLDDRIKETSREAYKENKKIQIKPKNKSLFKASNN
jgi:hypothetical protein